MLLLLILALGLLWLLRFGELFSRDAIVNVLLGFTLCIRDAWLLLSVPFNFYIRDLGKGPRPKGSFLLLLETKGAMMIQGSWIYG